MEGLHCKSVTTEILVIMIISTGFINCTDKSPLEENSDGRIPCLQDVYDGSIRRVKWHKHNNNDWGEALVSWDGKTRPYTSENYGIHKDFSLIISNATVSNDGYFKCVLTRSGLTMLTYYINIIVYQADEHVQSVLMERGTNAHLRCHYKVPTFVATDSTTIVNWYMIRNMSIYQLNTTSLKTGGPLTSQRYVLANDLSLTIHNIAFDDHGLYRCIVMPYNATWTSATDIELDVFAKPRKYPAITYTHRANGSYVTCKVENVYPEMYPNLDRCQGRRSVLLNNDGTFNVSISCVVPNDINDTSVECSISTAAYVFSSHVKLEKNNSEHGTKNTGCSTGIYFLYGFLSGAAMFLICALICFFIVREAKRRLEKVD